MRVLPKLCFFCWCLFITVKTSAQPGIIHYGNDSLLINETLIQGTISKEKLDNLMQSDSRNGVIIKTRDEILGTTKEKQRYFGYAEYGVIYKPFVKKPENFTLSIRFAFEGDEAKALHGVTSHVYTGLLSIGKQYINQESTLEKIIADPSFTLIKKANMVINKKKVVYAIVRFQDILVKLLYHTENGLLKLVELNK